ncbi:serine-rich adhesin for platelets-like [Frieseomelitta varia]|uniref:serine-rich adhesin for platelets-like n=1 Tax=Frieseomelitta varia TaxID=561572 RepID=UPI001CB67C17|nr:serine-rich adhesin for platelets-like [Frieseomelitta varia]
MKSFILIFLLQFVVLIVVSQPVSELAEVDDTDNINYGAHRYPRNLKSKYPPCKINQYFDEDKGHCMSVIGGGRALYINNTKSCESNTLIPHCTNPRYYYICKKDKIILAECSQKRHFDTHLQKCVLVPRGKYISAINRENSDILDSSQHLECRKLGSFPVPNNCGLFYTCSVSGHRMHQNFYTCPKNTAYDTETELCKPSHTCHQRKPSPLCEDRLFQQLSRSSGEEKLRHCETIFTDEEETTTSTSHEDKILSTTTARAVPPISEFTGSGDNSDIITTTERAPEKSRSTNTDLAIRTTETIAEDATTEVNSPTVINDNEELSTTLGPSEDHTETTTNDSNEQSGTASTILNDSTTPGNKEPEISTNEPSAEIPSSEEISQNSTTETESIGITSSILVDPETSSNTESEEQITETSSISSTTSLEIETTEEPNVENQTPSGSAENATTPSNSESNEEPILPTEPSLEIPTDESDFSTTGESTTEINTASTILTSSSSVENELTTEINPPLVEITAESEETKGESVTGIVPTEPSSEIGTPGVFIMENQEFTEEPITETEITDITPNILTDSPLSSIKETHEETNTETDTNNSSLEITTPRKNSEDDGKESNEQVPNEDESTESSNNNWNGMITTEPTSWISTVEQPLLQNDNTAPEINTEEIITEKPNSMPSESDISSIDLTSVTNDDFDAHIESSTEPVKSSYKRPHSPITDTENVCNNVAEKESATKPNHTHFEKMRSKNVALPLASAVSSIIDKIKHCLKKIFEELHH